MKKAVARSVETAVDIVDNSTTLIKGLARSTSNATAAASRRMSSLAETAGDGAKGSTGNIAKKTGGRARSSGSMAESGADGAKGSRTATDAANKAVKKKSLTKKVKTAAKYSAGATLAGTFAYSGIDAAVSGKNFSETFEKNISTVAGGVGSVAKTTIKAGATVATPVVSGVAGGLFEGLGVNNMFSGINSSMISFFIVIIVLYFVLAGDSQQSN